MSLNLENASTLLLLVEFRGHGPHKSQNSARNSNCKTLKNKQAYVATFVSMFIPIGNPTGSQRHQKNNSSVMNVLL